MLDLSIAPRRPWIIGAFLLAACANVTDGGIGGTGGNGTGGNAGRGGGGVGGAGGGPVVPEPLRTPIPDVPDNIPFAAEPGFDEVDEDLGVALGTISGECTGGLVCSGEDPGDQWLIRATETGVHSIELAWVSDTVDLDLVLADLTPTILASSRESGNTPELIEFSLTAGESYVIQVEAFNTFGLVQPYALGVSAP